MAKALNSVIGLDLGRYALKSVVLQRRGPGRVALTHYASRPVQQPLQGPEQLGSEVRALLKQLGSGVKACTVAVSSPDAILRVIEQPETPTELLREALRLNGMALLNQDCREFVLDCDKIEVSAPESLERGKFRYLVGGLPRAQVTSVHKALDGANANIHALQLGPISLFNAFEFGHPQVFAEEAFFLVDIGFASSTMVLGAKRELVLVRTVDVGGQSIIEALMALSGESRDAVLIALEQEDEFMVENARVALGNLTREIGSSIGFFEGRREETIGRVYLSGGVAKSRTLIKVIGEELHMPCTSWSAVEACEINLPNSKRDAFASDALDLHVACGAAAEALNS
jgi:type IV pilus assembly protein PilM